ncbi:hypothetical protein F5H01DRAFT_379211 [Linnemannia elongata]|nr:hypothetical protein F5H01DRAFT_379211 [Linnemannia elongata]
MKISSFAIIAAVVAVVVASPVPTSPQSVDSPSLKPANVSAVLPEDLIAKRDVAGLVKRVNEHNTYLGHFPTVARGAWTGAYVASGVLASQFQQRFLQSWDSLHSLSHGCWIWNTKIEMDGIEVDVAVSILDHYEVDAAMVAGMVYSVVATTTNSFATSAYNVLDYGDRGTKIWGSIRFTKLR